ncbi:MAG TPA: ECF-type sigma factor [Gemmatimonadales bacterium]|jgi:RNA polymerase sigma factor (TIGR02999 family)|nr:ECF-type sigma factor [Gemmatimonadales bacterium]
MGRADPTQLLAEWRQGSREALDALFSLVYEDLRARAHRLLQGQPTGLTLSTTALVHESYLKLIRSERLSLQDRAHFLALAAHAMRLVLVSYARGHGAEKRGGGATPLELDEELVLSNERAEQLLALDEALERLARLNDRLSRTVELRFFGGLTLEETAEALRVAQSTVKLDWQKARAWLYRELRDA